MRLKTRIKQVEKERIAHAAHLKAQVDVVPRFKEYINTLTLKERAIIAWRILRGKF